MSKEKEQIILQEYEYLLGARYALARDDSKSYESFSADIREDVSSEYNASLDDKIERWIDITHFFAFTIVTYFIRFDKARQLFSRLKENVLVGVID